MNKLFIILITAGICAVSMGAPEFCPPPPNRTPPNCRRHQPPPTPPATCVCQTHSSPVGCCVPPPKPPGVRQRGQGYQGQGGRQRARQGYQVISRHSTGSTGSSIWDINKNVASSAVEETLIKYGILTRSQIDKMKSTIEEIRVMIAQKHGKTPSTSQEVIVKRRHILINDMLYDQDQLDDWKHELQFETNKRGKRQIYLQGLWQRRQVIWMPANDLDPTAKSAFEDAIKEFHNQTHLLFSEMASATNVSYVHVFVTSSSAGCYSTVGFGRMPLARILNLGSGCHTIGTALHELMHAIGFNHHQTRSDSSNYVNINWDNIESEREINFERNNWSLYGQTGYYDFRSLLHYGSNYFSLNGELTMETSDAGNQDKITTPNRKTFSQHDLEAINAIYGNSINYDPFPAILNSICPKSLSDDRSTKLQCEDLDDVCINICKQLPSKSRACFDCYNCNKGVCILTSKPIRVDNQDAQACDPNIECTDDGCCPPGAQCRSGRCYTPPSCSSRNERCAGSIDGCCKNYEKCEDRDGTERCFLSDDLSVFKSTTTVEPEGPI